jgi:hypothetical protein
MRFALASFLIAVCGGPAGAAVPDIATFRAVLTYPAPAGTASIVLGASDSQTGRLVFWDGDTVYRQSVTGSTLEGTFAASGAGYAGDPSFVAIQSNNRTVILGSGVDGALYRISDIGQSLDFAAGSEIAVPTHFSGALLGDRYVILDRTRGDLAGAELVLVDLSVSPPAFSAVLQKPAGSQPAALTLNPSNGRLLVMNPTTRELRSFGQTALINAFTAATSLDWFADGTPIGAIGQFLNGGVYGVTPAGELVLGGDENAAGTGGIQWVNPNSLPASVLATLDPAGTAPPYVLIYSRKLDQVIAIDPSVSPPVAYASTTIIPAIPPDSPCSEFTTVQTQFAAFIAQYSPGSTDLDGDTIPDTAMLELIKLYSCRTNNTDALAFATNTAYDDNREILALEANAPALSAYSDVVPLLLFMNQAMRDAVLGLLSGAGTALSGSYSTVTCTDTDTCLPFFVEDPVARQLERGAYEPYFGSGDADGDGITNLEEYQNVAAMNGDDLDFAVAAASEQLDGTGGVHTGSGGCFIATAAYGTPMAKELDRLRALRDQTLLVSPAGAVFVDTYYRLSPPAAAWIADRPAMRAAARVLLAPVLNRNTGIAAALVLATGTLLLAVAMRRTTGAVQRK